MPNNSQEQNQQFSQTNGIAPFKASDNLCFECSDSTFLVEFGEATFLTDAIVKTIALPESLQDDIRIVGGFRLVLGIFFVKYDRFNHFVFVGDTKVPHPPLEMQVFCRVKWVFSQKTRRSLYHKGFDGMQNLVFLLRVGRERHQKKQEKALMVRGAESAQQQPKTESRNRPGHCDPLCRALSAPAVEGEMVVRRCCAPAVTRYSAL